MPNSLEIFSSLDRLFSRPSFYLTRQIYSWVNHFCGKYLLLCILIQYTHIFHGSRLHLCSSQVGETGSQFIGYQVIQAKRHIDSEINTPYKLLQWRIET